MFIGIPNNATNVSFKCNQCSAEIELKEINEERKSICCKAPLIYSFTYIDTDEKQEEVNIRDQHVWLLIKEEVFYLEYECKNCYLTHSMTDIHKGKKEHIEKNLPKSRCSYTKEKERYVLK